MWNCGTESPRMRGNVCSLTHVSSGKIQGKYATGSVLMLARLWTRWPNKVLSPWISLVTWLEGWRDCSFQWGNYFKCLCQVSLCSFSQKCWFLSLVLTCIITLKGRHSSGSKVQCRMESSTWLIWAKMPLQNEGKEDLNLNYLENYFNSHYHFACYKHSWLLDILENKVCGLRGFWCAFIKNVWCILIFLGITFNVSD